MIDPGRTLRRTPSATWRALRADQSPTEVSQPTMVMAWRWTTLAISGVCWPWGGRKKAGQTPRLRAKASWVEPSSP